MKAARYFVTVIFLLIFSFSKICAQDSVQVLSLDDCIKTALNQSTAMLLSQDSVRITGAALMGAYGKFLPDLNLAGNYNYINGSNLYTSTEPVLVRSELTQLNYELTSTVNIFNGLTNYSSLKAAELSKSAAQFNL